MPVAFVGLGANLGDPAAAVRRALEQMSTWGELRASSLYESEPLGDPDQPWYVNAVAELATELSPEALLGRLQEVERAAGRPPDHVRWAPRVLDLDLLLYADRRIATPDLRVPHPGLARRRFVLEPLAELAPDARDPESGKSVRELLAALDDPLRVQKLPTRFPRIQNPG